MRVLVTNDDGISAPGLLTLVTHLVAAGHDVTVAAPHREASGSGTALGELTHGHRVALRRVRLPGLPQVPAFAFEAPPAFAALSGCVGLLGDPPDVVLAGINPGWNTGATVMHSSTVGAALTAASTGFRALAVSCGPLPSSRFDTAAQVACLALATAGSELEPGVVLNINVPDLDLDLLRGARSVPFATRGVHGVRLRRDADEVVVEERRRTHPADDLTDSAVVLEGWVSVTEVLPGFATRLAGSAKIAANLDALLRSNDADLVDQGAAS